MMSSQWSDQLRRASVERISTHIWTKAAYDQAFPTFFRFIGAEVRTRLGAARLETTDHVGADLRSAWLARLPRLPEDVSLNWVAFDFPGLSVWDLHIGVLAHLETWPATCTVGLHVLEPHWPAVEALLARESWQADGWLGDQPVRVASIEEVQLNDPVDKLNLNDLPGEADRLVNRAVQLYGLLRPLALELAGQITSRR
jgi:hypothetical protein